MDHCDALIVGAGPAGSACAWGLRNAGLDVVLLESKRFPRNKVCAGWITPAVLEELGIRPAEYASERVLQPITGFRVGAIGDGGREIEYGRVISYSIRRCEFDEFLARRSGARLIEETPLTSLERSGDGWIANGSIRAPLVIGAGGHFCPVARLLGAKATHEIVVAAQEIEFELDASQRARTPVRGEVPELYFCADLRGYGWCIRKQNFLNVGIGRLSERQLNAHTSDFVSFLKHSERLPFDLPGKLLGHAYLLYGEMRQNLVQDGALLIGDAAGLASSPSGEGIRPAIESGLLAARTIIEAKGRYTRPQLESYRRRLALLFGNKPKHWTAGIGRFLSRNAICKISRPLLASRWFARKVILDRWFLHVNVPALSSERGSQVPRTTGKTS